MLLPFVPQTPAHKRSYPRRTSGSAPAPATDVLVVEVRTVSSAGNAADFVFSLPVTCDGFAVPELAIELPVFGWMSADYTEQVSPNIVRIFVTEEAVAAGQPWVVSGVPSGFDLHGATMPVPQNGIVQE